MKKYELTYLVPLELDDADLKKIQQEIESLVAENKGEILISQIDPARRELGDEIGGTKNARMSTIVFNLNPTEISKLEKFVKEEKKILRHILIFKPEIKPDKKREEPKLESEKKSSEKVELKEIDKKIEEILNE